MSEDVEGPESGAEASAAGVDPVAASLALGGASRDRADSFLKMQEALIAKQNHHLDEQLKNLRLTIWEKRMGVLLRAATAFVGIAVAGFLGAFVWSAARADGLVVESFSMPPDLAARGLSGEVVASALLDKLSSIQSQTSSSRAASTFANNWGNEIKVEIPETGVSLGELNRYLREWLGHETHITGAVYHTEGGIAVAAQMGEQARATVTGSEADLDQLLQKTAEAIYRGTQPYRYAVYLRGTPRTEEAIAAFEDIIANGSSVDRPWAINGLGNLYILQGDYERGLPIARQALDEQPDLFVSLVLFANVESGLQQDEAALAAVKKVLAAKPDPNITRETFDTMLLGMKANLARLQGDYSVTFELMRTAGPNRRSKDWRQDPENMREQAYLGTHDLAAYQSTHDAFEPSGDFLIESGRVTGEISTYAARGHWRELLDKRAAVESDLAKLIPYPTQYVSRQIWPFVAYAMVMTGDAKSAHALIDKTPADCSLCLRMRGRIDATEKNWGGADYWFARAAAFTPSTPFPFRDWGNVLLLKGDADGAIAQFIIGNKNGPHFADPLEGWGEALMMKNQPRLALTKFEQAAKYAPNWGRLHLKWGEALANAGKPQEAKKQFAIAAGLDLVAADRAELDQMRSSDP
jgi:tetratricopeptide (TPR) repeat protein